MRKSTPAGARPAWPTWCAIRGSIPTPSFPICRQPNPLVTFKLADIAFVYGSKWKQRYFTKVGDDYFPLPAQWDVANKVWRAYKVPAGADWWVPHYPGDNMQRPTGPLCDGCHSVNYNIQTHAVTEWNVGCEKCHGPGAAHAAQPSRANIVNPARLDPRAGQRRLHPVPFAGASAALIRSRAATTTGRWAMNPAGH